MPQTGNNTFGRHTFLAVMLLDTPLGQGHLSYIQYIIPSDVFLRYLKETHFIRIIFLIRRWSNSYPQFEMPIGINVRNICDHQKLTSKNNQIKVYIYHHGAFMVVKYILCLPHPLLEMILEWPFEFGNTPLWTRCSKLDANSVWAYLATV